MTDKFIPDMMRLGTQYFLPVCNHDDSSMETFQQAADRYAAQGASAVRYMGVVYPLTQSTSALNRMRANGNTG